MSGDESSLRDAIAGYYDRPIEHYEQVARERVDEWDYDADQHGYCHERPVLVAMLAETDRLRAELQALRRDAEIGRWVREHEPYNFNTNRAGHGSVASYRAAALAAGDATP